MRRLTGPVAAFALAVFLALPGATRATVIIQEGNNPQPDENVLLTPDQTGMTVFGETNNTNVPIQFTSSQELTTPASGQARIEESSGDPLLNIMVLVPDGFYESLIFNANGDGDGTNMDPSMITIEVLDNMGETTMATFELGNGSNFFTITTDALQSIVKTTITSDLGWDDLRQVRIGGARTIPEPSSIALGFIGTVGLVLFRRAGRNLGKR